MSVYGGPDIITDGLVLHLDAGNSKSYPGSGTSWNDLSGNGNVSSWTTGISFNPQNNGVFTFDGNSASYMSIPNNSSLQITDQITLCAWIYRTGWSNYPGIISKGYDTGGEYSFHIRGSGESYKVHFELVESDGTRNYLQAGSITANTWHHICCTHDGSVRQIFQNGILKGSASKTFSIASRSNSLDIGRLYGWGKFQGDISNVQVYNKALSANKVQQNYNALKGRYGLT